VTSRYTATTLSLSVFAALSAPVPSSTQSYVGAQARSGANLSIVSEDERNQERDDRDRQRSDEAHWRVAEEGAEGRDDEPKQMTEKSQEETRTVDK